MRRLTVVGLPMWILWTCLSLLCCHTANNKPLSFPPVSLPAATPPNPLYRMYNPGSGDHFYTSSHDEKEKAMFGGYEDEGIAAYLSPLPNPPKIVPLIRLYGPSGHFYTTDVAEAAQLQQHGWNLENGQGYVEKQQSFGTVPLYRLVDAKGFHLYTTSQSEVSSAAPRYKLEGICCYVWTTGAAPFVRLTLWKDSGFAGPRLEATKDMATLPSYITSQGSAISVPAGVIAYIFSKEGYGGSELILQGPVSIPDLSKVTKVNHPGFPGNWNDEITSFKFISNLQPADHSDGTFCIDGQPCCSNGYQGCIANHPIPPPACAPNITYTFTSGTNPTSQGLIALTNATTHKSTTLAVASGSNTIACGDKLMEASKQLGMTAEGVGNSIRVCGSPVLLTYNGCQFTQQ